MENDDIYEQMARNNAKGAEQDERAIATGAAILRAILDEDGMPKEGAADILGSIISKIVNTTDLSNLEFDNYETEFMVNMTVLTIAASLKAKYPDLPFEL